MNQIATIPSSHADPDAAFQQGLLELIPFLRAFARSLCGNRDMADDLAQDALTKAWQARASFRVGTNLKAWLFIILRHQYYSNRRRAWRQVAWDEAAAERVPAPPEEQAWAVDLSDMMRALEGLSAEQREALILVGAGGFTHKDAAVICNCAVGTVKSRVARARKALIESLEGGGQLPPPAKAQSSSAKESALHQIMAQLAQFAPANVRVAA